MNIISKTLALILLSFAIMLNISFAQHSHERHSDLPATGNEQNMEEPEDLPSGLSKMKPDHNDMNADCCKSEDKQNMDMDCCKSNKKNNMDMAMDCCKSVDKHTDMKDHNMDMDSNKSSKSSLVREGEIDLQEIDKNKDGKVFQDTMDWNVISDEPGECPLCGMKLKEVTLEKAKENLIKQNFKVTE